MEGSDAVAPAMLSDTRETPPKERKMSWFDELKPITREEALQALKDLQVGGDIEAEHGEADDILCRVLKTLGEAEIVQEWEKVDKWYA